MQLKKCLVYVAFVLFFSLDPYPVLGATSDCHPRISAAYFSTLLQADKQEACDICEIGGANLGFVTFMETIPSGNDSVISHRLPSVHNGAKIREAILSGHYPVISIFGAKPVMPSRTVPWFLVTSSTMMHSRMIIKGPLNPLVMALLVPWKSDMKEFWARSRLARW